MNIRPEEAKILFPKQVGYVCFPPLLAAIPDAQTSLLLLAVIPDA
jgi:hypothetical protein